jgi:hypothetical protein
MTLRATERKPGASFYEVIGMTVPRILNSVALKTGGALFIAGDEAASGDGPIGMIVLSPFGKGKVTKTSFPIHTVPRCARWKRFLPYHRF